MNIGELLTVCVVGLIMLSLATLFIYIELKTFEEYVRERISELIMRIGK